MRRFLERVNWILILGMIGFAVWAWPQLPEQIPTHFGIDGAADAWIPLACQKDVKYSGQQSPHYHPQGLNPEAHQAE
jgi:hypothetical protein